jgi:hypothetical protein
MSIIAQELDSTLSRLDPDRAKNLEQLVRDALVLAAHGTPPKELKSSWPAGYFEATAGAFAGEIFERPPQGSFPNRDVW